MKDSNENPLPGYINRTTATTIRDFLEHMNGVKPYTLRIGGNGPVKVYLPDDMPLLTKIYAAWHEQQRRRYSTVKDTKDQQKET